MFRALLAFLLLSTLPAVSLAANDGSQEQQRFKWWQGEQARQLGLSNDQSSRIEAIYQSSSPRFQAAMQDAETAQNELNKLIAGEKTTEVDVIRQLVKVQAARNEANRQFTLMLFRFYQELSPEQRQKVQAMHARREQERRGRRGDVPPRRETRK